MPEALRGRSSDIWHLLQPAGPKWALAGQMEPPTCFWSGESAAQRAASAEGAGPSSPESRALALVRLAIRRSRELRGSPSR